MELHLSKAVCFGAFPKAEEYKEWESKSCMLISNSFLAVTEIFAAAHVNPTCHWHHILIQCTMVNIITTVMHDFCLVYRFCFDRQQVP